MEITDPNLLFFLEKNFLQLWVVLGAIFRFFSTFLEDSVEATGTIENAIDLCIYLYRDGFFFRESGQWAVYYTSPPKFYYNVFFIRWLKNIGNFLKF